MKSILRSKLLFCCLFLSLTTFAKNEKEALPKEFAYKADEKSIFVRAVAPDFCIEDKKQNEDEKDIALSPCGTPLIIYGCDGVEFMSEVACDFRGALLNVVLLLIARETCLN
jgi:hypothetical protein